MPCWKLPTTLPLLTSNYSMFWAPGREKFVAFTGILWGLVGSEALVISSRIPGLAFWEAILPFLGPVPPNSKHTYLVVALVPGPLNYSGKNAAAMPLMHSHPWLLDKNLIKHGKISPDAARMPHVLLTFW